MSTYLEFTYADSPIEAGSERDMGLDTEDGPIVVLLPPIESLGNPITVIVIEATNSVTVQPVAGEKVFDGESMVDYVILDCLGQGIDFVPTSKGWFMK